jgi:hypothetical protein
MRPARSVAVRARPRHQYLTEHRAGVLMALVLAYDVRRIFAQRYDVTQATVLDAYTMV